MNEVSKGPGQGLIFHFSLFRHSQTRQAALSLLSYITTIRSYTHRRAQDSEISAHGDFVCGCILLFVPYPSRLYSSISIAQEIRPLRHHVVFFSNWRHMVQYLPTIYPACCEPRWIFHDFQGASRSLSFRGPRVEASYMSKTSKPPSRGCFLGSTVIVASFYYPERLHSATPLGRHLVWCTAPWRSLTVGGALRFLLLQPNATNRFFGRVSAKRSLALPYRERGEAWLED